VNCGSLEEAVEKALRMPHPRRRTSVASLRELDMFRDYRHRGEIFAAAVKRAPGVSRTYVFARSAPSAEYDRSLAWAAFCWLPPAW